MDDKAELLVKTEEPASSSSYTDRELPDVTAVCLCMVFSCSALQVILSATIVPEEPYSECEAVIRLVYPDRLERLFGR